jgi:hypothetical protein
VRRGVAVSSGACPSGSDPVRRAGPGWPGWPGRVGRSVASLKSHHSGGHSSPPPPDPVRSGRSVAGSDAAPPDPVRSGRSVAGSDAAPPDPVRSGRSVARFGAAEPWASPPSHPAARGASVMAIQRPKLRGRRSGDCRPGPRVRHRQAGPAASVAIPPPVMPERHRPTGGEVVPCRGGIAGPMARSVHAGCASLDRREAAQRSDHDGGGQVSTPGSHARATTLESCCVENWQSRVM